MSSNGRGFVVTFEGIDGSGKSTAISRLAKKLQDAQVKYTVIRDEGELTHLKDARDVFDLEGIDIDNPDVKFLLYIAQTTSKEPLYRSYTEKGMVVLVDRGIDTMIAYGTLFLGDKNESFYRGINRLIMTYFDKPDLTFLFACSSEERRHRFLKRGEEIPANFDVTERKLDAEYRSLVLSQPSRFRQLDTTELDEEEVVGEVWNHLKKELSRRKLCA